jgi:nicotinate-nucleotide adenylyltransferase
MGMGKSGTEVNIGIFGGTFDPIHYGHLRTAEEVRNLFHLEKVLFIPSADPPHKDASSVTSASCRLEMVRSAVGDHPPFHASDLECRMGGKSYSIETLHLLRDRFGNAPFLFFILGSDAFIDIPTWKDWEDLFGLTNFVVIARPGYPVDGLQGILPNGLLDKFDYEPQHQKFTHRSGYGVYFRRCSLIDISSTRIREMVKRGESIKYFLPKEVENYIDREGLYR